jgi:hypothetical protein
VVPYFRLDDSICRRFLELAADPREFEGLALLFPFLREMSVLRFNRAKSKLPVWMQLSFMAGHDLGRENPECVEEVLPGLELREATRRVSVLQQCSGEDHLTFCGLQRACSRIVEAQWGQVPEEKMEPVLLEAAVKSLRTGFAAGTVAQADPSRCEFVWDLPHRIGEGISDIVSRLLVGAPMIALGSPVVASLEHPLLRLARQYYPGKRMEPEVMLRFLRGQLKRLKVRSENDCPASELDLADWVSAGMDYGCRLSADHPEAVAAIFEECKDHGLDGTLDTIRAVVARAGGTDPLRLVQSLKNWQQRAFGWAEPGFYGEELARVVYFADFAVWIPWACRIHFGPRRSA